MNAVGIDVSKGKSTVTIRKPGNVVLMSPCDIPHTQSAINDLIKQIKSLEGETKVCMEHTGRYYEPTIWILYGSENGNEKQSHCTDRPDLSGSQ